MDFVVVGCGLGALIVLVGIAVRDFAPRLRRAPVADQPSNDSPRIFSMQTMTPERWADACREAALAILAGGGLIIVATIGAIAAHFDNRAGARLVLGAVLIAFGGIVIRLGILANHLFPLDRRARARARMTAERLQQADAGRAQTAANAESRPVAADQAVGMEPVVVTAIEANGAAPEPVVSESQPGTVSTVAPASQIPEATTSHQGHVTAESQPGDQAAADVPVENSTAGEKSAETKSSVADSVTEEPSEGDALGAAEVNDEATTMSQTPPEVAATTRTNTGS